MRHSVSKHICVQEGGKKNPLWIMHGKNPPIQLTGIHCLFLLNFCFIKWRVLPEEEGRCHVWCWCYNLFFCCHRHPGYSSVQSQEWLRWIDLLGRSPRVLAFARRVLCGCLVRSGGSEIHFCKENLQHAPWDVVSALSSAEAGAPRVASVARYRTSSNTCIKPTVLWVFLANYWSASEGRVWAALFWCARLLCGSVLRPVAPSSSESI